MLPEPAPSSTLDRLRSDEHASGGTAQRSQVLLVEDDRADQLLFRTVLERGELTVDVEVAGTVARARRLLAERPFDVVVLDLGLPGLSGLDAVDATVDSAGGAPVVVLTGLNDPDEAGIEALRRGAQDYLVKGVVGHTELVRAIRYAIERGRLQRDVTARTLESSALAMLESSAQRAGSLDEFLNTAVGVVRGALDAAVVEISIDTGAITTAVSSDGSREGAEGGGAAAGAPSPGEAGSPFPVASVPVVGASGRLGHVRVDAGGPRPLDDAQQEFVTAAAATVGGVVDRLATELELTERTRELRAAERAHDLATDRLRHVVATVPVGLVVTSSQGEPVYVNPAARRLLGLADEDPFPIELVRPSELPARGWEVSVDRPDGTPVTVSVDATALDGVPGGPAGTVLALSDVTAVEQRQQALAAALDAEHNAAEELRRVAQLKDTFLHAVSHELRTPLASVLGYTETLLEHGADLDSGSSTEMLQRVQRNAVRLRQMLEDLLDVGRLTAGSVEWVDREVADLAEIVAGAATEVALEGRRLVLDTAPTPVGVERSRIERVVDNLVRNAVRHTSPGTTVWVRTEADVDEARLVVEDDGPGVPVELRDTLFEPFHQGPDRTDGAAAPGTGIGLSLVRAFAQLHGGGVTVDDRPGGGARFVVRLPRDDGP